MYNARLVCRYGRYELFDNRGRNNVKQFQAWMHFLFVESCDPCKLTMWRVFQALYIGAPGACPSYDRMVRLEDFYPTLTQALKDYEMYSPGTVNWKVVREWQEQRKNTIKDGPVCPCVSPTLRWSKLFRMSLHADSMRVPSAALQHAPVLGV